MKKVLFSAVLLVFVFVGVANAFPTSPEFPQYTAAAQSPVATDASGTLGTAAAGTIKSNQINVATTKYVNTQAAALENPINTLASSAASDNSTVTTNGTAITALTSGRIDAPTGTGNTCPANQICGYISAPSGNNYGSTGTKQWVQIITQ